MIMMTGHVAGGKVTPAVPIRKVTPCGLSPRSNRLAFKDKESHYATALHERRSGLAVAAIPVMYFLSPRKLAVAERLESGALRADVIESITCGWLSFVVVLGLATQLALGASWVDSLASLAIVYFLIKEGREAWVGDECCQC